MEVVDVVVASTMPSARGWPAAAAAAAAASWTRRRMLLAVAGGRGSGDGGEK